MVPTVRDQVEPKKMRASSRWALGVCVLVVLLAGGYIRWRSSRSVEPTVAEGATSDAAKQVEAPSESVASAESQVQFHHDSWDAAGLEIQMAQEAPLAQTLELTGKITLNDDHVAHIYPLVEGRVDEVHVQFGDRVQKGQLLLVVQSKEVGKAMLELYQDRLHRDFARAKDAWTQQVAANTKELIETLRHDTSMEAIEERFQNRPMGEYREKLLSAYVSLYKSRMDYERLAPLSRDGVAPAKQLMAAEADRNADRAKLTAWMEQIDQEAQQSALVSQQTLKEADTRVSVDETNLKILGFDDASLEKIDPTVQGETISHYPIVSPFDGTVISKDAVLMERVGPESQLLSIADLSTVWVTTDIYEEHLPLLKSLAGEALRVRSDVWPDRTFEAKVFYTGDILHEESRTISMRAVADNSEGLLKPGMFVRVELPDLARSTVLQVPTSAIQEHDGQSFVFVHVREDQFERRTVKLGRSNREVVEILSGIRAGEPVVIRGGFALKSRMLESLLSEE